MARIFRRVIFFTFVAVFVVGAPKLVFHTLGYYVSADHSQGLVQSGLVYLSTAPPGAAVYVGGRRYRETTPAMIRDLIPGNYPIRLVLKDHYPWARDVPVEAGKATVLGSILLRPRQPDWKKWVREDFDSLTVIPETHFFLLERRGKKGRLDIYDWKTKTRHPAVSGENFPGFEIEKTYFSSGGDRVLVQGRQDRKERWLWLKINGEHTKAQFLSGFTYENPRDVMWDGRDERYLFFYDGKKIDRFDFYKNNTRSVFFEPVRGFDVKDRKVFYLSGNDFGSIDLSGKTARLIWKDADHFLNPEAPAKIFSFSDQIALFLDDRGKLVTNHPPQILAESGVRGIHYDKKKRLALAWSEKSIQEIEFAKPELGREASFPEIRQKVAFEGGKNIRRAFWAHDGAYYVYQDQNKVYLLEPQPFSVPLVYELLEVKEGSLAFYSDETGEIFYLEKKSGHLMSLEIVPKWKVLEVPLALIREKEGGLQR